MAQPAVPEVPLSLALQGGGAWGAYTWGVLDELVGHPELPIEQLSGTSAGAVNGAIVASALARGSAHHARDALASFWRQMAQAPQAAMLTAWLGPIGQAVTEQLSHWALSTGVVSPYQANPLNLNPLRDAIAAHVDAEALRGRGAPALYVAATNVRTGLPRVFGPAEITVDTLMASACLPQLFQAVMIDGEPYWDGGYCGNPAVWPLIRNGSARDLLLVQLSAGAHGEVPQQPAEIRQRVGEIVFNASLVAEMQAIQAMRRMQPDGAVAQTRFHRIGPPRERAAAGKAGGALDRSWARLKRLHGQGRRDAARFVAHHRADLGARSTLDLAATYLNPSKPRLRRAAVSSKAALPDRLALA